MTERNVRSAQDFVDDIKKTFPDPHEEAISHILLAKTENLEPEDVNLHIDFAARVTALDNNYDAQHNILALGEFLMDDEPKLRRLFREHTKTRARATYGLPIAGPLEFTDPEQQRLYEAEINDGAEATMKSLMRKQAFDRITDTTSGT